MSTRSQRGSSTTQTHDSETMGSVLSGAVGASTGSSTGATTATSTRETSYRNNSTEPQQGGSGSGGGQQVSNFEQKQNESEAGEKLGLFQKHAWMVPATVVVSIIVAFGLMMLLNWAAGGGAPFTR